MAFYDKKHLFSLAGEDKIYTAGNEKVIIQYKNFKICPMICYDLRFPVFARNTADYDVLIFVANWPDTRINAWDTLLKARAIENMCYTIGVNRIGTDNSKLNYIGHSQAIDYLGNHLITPQKTEGVFNCQLDKEKMLKTREKLGFLNDKDDFELKS
jgi:predicted amidohydrolase